MQKTSDEALFIRIAPRVLVSNTGELLLASVCTDADSQPSVIVQDGFFWIGKVERDGDTLHLTNERGTSSFKVTECQLLCLLKEEG